MVETDPTTEEGDDPDSSNETPGNRPADGGYLPTRRSLLTATTSGLVGSLLAGCSGLRKQTFEAKPVSLAPEARERGYVFEDAQTIRATRKASEGGQTVEATIVSHVAAYDHAAVEADERSSFLAEPSVGLASTPPAEVLGKSLNPLATKSLSELLQADTGKQFLREMGIDATDWQRGPREVGAGEVRILDDQAEVKTFLGVVDDEVALINAVRVRDDGDVVLVGDARTRTYEGETPLTDAVDRSTREKARDAFGEVTPLVVRQPADDDSGSTTTTTTTASNLENSPFSSISVDSLGAGYKRYVATVEIPTSGEGTYERTVVLDDPKLRRELNARAPDFSSSPSLSDPGNEADLGGGVALVGELPDRMEKIATEPLEKLEDEETPPPPQASLRSNQTSLRYQGGRGTCVIFCIVAAMEANLNRQGFYSPDLSEQYGQHVSKMINLHMRKGNPSTPNKCVKGKRNGPIDTDGFENGLGMWGGGAVGYELSQFSRYGLPDERDAKFQVSASNDRTYVFDGDFESTNQTGDDPRVKWCNPKATTQKDINDYNVEHGTIQVPINSSRTLRMRPFPREALKNANYRLDSYVYVGGGSKLKNPTWFEKIIGNQGREVIISFPSGACTTWYKKKPKKKDFSTTSAYNQAIRKWKNNNGDVYSYDKSKGCGGWHCMLLVGYKRNATPPHFIAKNSWGTYTKLGYDVVKKGLLGEAGVVTGVKKVTGNLRDQDFLGRWNLDYNGLDGTLDIYRKPSFYKAKHLGGARDRRIGTFFDDRGNAHRVNGSMQSGSNRIDFSFETAGVLDYDEQGSMTFTGYMDYSDRDFMAGTYSTGNASYGFFGVPSHETSRSPVIQYSNLRKESFLGEWKVRSSVFDGVVDIEKTSGPVSGSFSGTVRDSNGATAPVSGQENHRSQALRFTFPSKFGGWKFDGYIHTYSLGNVSGRVRKGTGSNMEHHPMKLTRVGMADPKLKIVKPIQGATVSGPGISCEARVRGDPTPDRALIWTLDGPYDPGAKGHGTIFGFGNNAVATATKGQHTITATYTGTSPSKTQTVTITVQ